MKYFIFLILFFNSLFIQATTIETKSSMGVGPRPKITVHVISIGINDNTVEHMNYCVSDSKAIVEKIKSDTIYIYDGPRESPRRKLDLLYNIHLLNDKAATLSGVKEALKDIISKASRYDYFVFFYGGMSLEGRKVNDTFLLPYGVNMVNFEEEGLSMRELSQFLEQIQCKNQVIISEAGNGSSFNQNLITHLFESNSLISTNTDRNRIIVTTKGIGYENKELKGGVLVYYLLNSGVKLLDIFKDIENFEYEVFKAEIKFPVHGYEDRRYSAIFNENDYKKILLNGPTSRGSIGTNTTTENKSTKTSNPKTYALLIATNNYNAANEWRSLKNPINDAESIAKIIETKYNVIVNKIYNKSQDSILEEIIKIKKLMRENDKFIFFIAGHGYYSSNLSDGFLVLQDSDILNQDIGLKSYLSMATLKMLLDNMPSKNVFAIFDVCFGASFDLLSKDIKLGDYTKIEKDISLDEFIERKNDKCSRIFLASGRYEVPDYWNNSLKHSPFADKLIKTLEKQKDFISPGILFSELEGNATEPFLKQFGRHEERGDFLLKAVN